MELIPAIDLRAGRCVRLLRGNFAEESDYGEPVAHARALTAAGATRLHVVDLDAARGDGDNRRVIFDLLASVEVPVQVGGGVRDRARALELLESGVERVVLGTAALRDEAFARSLAAEFPGRVLLGLDHRRDATGKRLVAIAGWEQSSGESLESVLERFADVAFAGVVITDIGVDGTLEGPDLAGYELALGRSAVPVIASGGIGSLAHLRALSDLVVQGRGLAGVIVGKALYSGAIDLGEALRACAA